MASRNINNQSAFHQRPRGGALPVGKQNNAVAAEGKNRRALEDIGNLVNVPVAEGKPPTQISRPVTRSFGALLRANAQTAAAVAAKNKKPAAPAAGEVPVRVAAAKQTKQQLNVVAVKNNNIKPEAVVDEPKQSDQKKKASSSSSASRRKGAHSLTSVLTARSKAACGLVDGIKDDLLQIPDIDSQDASNQLAVVDYVEDIYSFYKLSEGTSRIRDYMESQAEINGKMRAILADWLIEVHHKFELMPETLYLSFHIIDRYLSAAPVPRRELQLVGMGAMLIACKYEEIWAPEVSDFISISDKAYSREQILAMEKGILNKLEWRLTLPTPYVFLVRYLKAAHADEEMKHMVFFFEELALMNYSMIMYKPSLIAASAVYVAQCTLQKIPIWCETLKRHTGFSEPQLWECAELLAGFHSEAGQSKLKVVFKRYSSAERLSVALHPPATKMMQEIKRAAAASSPLPPPTST